MALNSIRFPGRKEMQVGTPHIVQPHNTQHSTAHTVHTTPHTAQTPYTAHSTAHTEDTAHREHTTYTAYKEHTAHIAHTEHTAHTEHIAQSTAQLTGDRTVPGLSLRLAICFFPYTGHTSPTASEFQSGTSNCL